MKVMVFTMMSAEQTDAGKPPTEAALLAMHKYTEELQRAGVLLDLGGLTPPARGVRVTYKGGKRTVTDGPFAEAKEVVAGYALLEVKSLAEAVEWVKRAPYDVSGGEAEVEIRPLFDPSEFDTPGEAEARANKT